MLYSGTDPESYITEHTIVYEEKQAAQAPPGGTRHQGGAGASQISIVPS